VHPQYPIDCRPLEVDLNNSIMGDDWHPVHFEGEEINRNQCSWVSSFYWSPRASFSSNIKIVTESCYSDNSCDSVNPHHRIWSNKLRYYNQVGIINTNTVFLFREECDEYRLLKHNHLQPDTTED
jgi:hypothetical protein